MFTFHIKRTRLNKLVFGIFSLGITIIECAYGFYPIPMVNEQDLMEHLDRWAPAMRRPRTQSTDNLADMSEDEHDQTYMERTTDYQPFQLLEFLNNQDLSMTKNKY